MKRLGLKGQEWEKVKRQIKPKFEALGLTHCEYHGASCTHNWCLTWAHLRKRRHLLPGELKVVALLCQPIHQAWEALPPREMHKNVLQVILARSAQPVEIPPTAHYFHLDPILRGCDK